MNIYTTLDEYNNVRVFKSVSSAFDHCERIYGHLEFENNELTRQPASIKSVEKELRNQRTIRLYEPSSIEQSIIIEHHAI
jgi:hypothetical protein